MSYKTDSGDGGKGVPPKETKGRRGIPTKMPQNEKGEQEAGRDNYRKSYLQRFNIVPQGSYLRRGNGIPSGSIHRKHQGPGELCRSEVL